MGCSGDAELQNGRQGNAPHGVVARNHTANKVCGHRAAEHADAQPTMTQRLIVIRDGFRIDARSTECARDISDRLALRELPQAAEQPTGRAPREDELATLGQPQRFAREDRQCALLLARGDDRKRRLATLAGGGAGLRDRAEQALRRGRRAQRRTELHQALIEISRCELGGQRGHQLARPSPQRALAGG